ncbi:hypothetical protein Tco_1187876, partial [Tanacetum coccineum]
MSRGRAVKKEITETPTKPKKQKKQPLKKKKLQLQDESSESEGEPEHKPHCLTLTQKEQSRRVNVKEELSTRWKAQVKELALRQGFLMSYQGKLKSQMKELGSTDDEDPILPEDKDKLKQKAEDIPWVSSDNDESDDEEDEVFDEERNESDAERDESDEEKSVDIEKSDEEKTDSDVDEKEVKKVEMPEEQKVDEEQKDEEVHEGVEQPMDEQVEVPVFATQQEKPTLLQLTSSHSISSNFANQFLNSPNASLVGTIPKNTEPEIISMMDVHIQQEVPVLQQEPYQSVTVSVIPESTQQPPSTPPPPATQAPPETTEALATQVPNTEAVSSVVQRFTKLEEFVKQLKEADIGKFIHDEINSQVPSTVEKYLRTSMPEVFRKELQNNTANLKKELS